MKGARILIVDDEPLNRELLHAYLDDGDHVLTDADSGEAALELAAREPPDLVLLDIMMPGIDGYETTRRLKEQAGRHFLPIILFTSLTDRAARLRGLETGADEFLSKPVDGEELRARVRNLLALRAKEVLLAERNVALAELNRFKDEMSALLVHDLKNPMTVILGNLAYIETGLGGGDESHREALDDTREATKHILRLIANLMDVTRMEASRLELRRAPASIAGIFDGIFHARRHLVRSKRVTVELAAPPEVTAQVDVDLITRVGENLVDNAFRYIGEQARIVVDAEVLGDRVRVMVGNNGPPVPEGMRALIFEKFGQTAGKVGRMNLGLGLYFCRLAVEAHGGRIWVEQTPALPTRFVIELPR